MAGTALEKGSVVRVRSVNDGVEEQGPPSSWVGRGEVQNGFFESAIARIQPVPFWPLFPCALQNANAPQTELAAVRH